MNSNKYSFLILISSIRFARRREREREGEGGGVGQGRGRGRDKGERGKGKGKVVRSIGTRRTISAVDLIDVVVKVDPPNLMVECHCKSTRMIRHSLYKD